MATYEEDFLAMAKAILGEAGVAGLSFNEAMKAMAAEVVLNGVGGGGGTGGTQDVLLPQYWGLPGMIPQEGGAQTLDINKFMGHRFRLSSDQAYDRYGLRVTTAVAASSVQVGIFKLVGSTWTLEHDAGAVATATTGDKLITVARTLGPGDYVVGCTASHAGIGIESLKGRFGYGGRDAGGNPVFAPSYPRWWAGAHTFGALPGTLALGPELDWNVAFTSVILRGA